MSPAERGDPVFSADEIPDDTTRLASFEAALGGRERGGSVAAAGRVQVPRPTRATAAPGVLSLPLRPDQLSALVASASRAPYGRGDATLHDDTVRRTWQLAPEAVEVLHPAWTETSLPAITSAAARALGVDGAVTANPYKLLVYEPGDFFVAHRDTEKEPGMFATLVVALPSAHTGGELVIEHEGEQFKADLRAVSLSGLSWAAFYTDCLHHLEPIRTGHRVCLVYNLVCEGPLRAPTPLAARRSAALALTELAAAPALPGEDGHVPWKIVRILEHHYTPASLGEDSLKGRDAAVAAALRGAAEDTGWTCLLGMVSISEVGMAEGSWGYERSWRDRYRKADDLDEEWRIVEVTERALRVEDLKAPGGGTWASGWLPLDPRELTPWDALAAEPFDDEHFTEATGNEGASFERTYRRAALVLFPSEREWDVIGQLPSRLVAPALLGQLRAGAPEAPQRVADWLGLATRKMRYGHDPDILRLVGAAAASDDAALRDAALRYLVHAHSCAEGCAGLPVQRYDLQRIVPILAALGKDPVAGLLREVVTRDFARGPAGWDDVGPLFRALCEHAHDLAVAVSPFVARALPMAPVRLQSQSNVVRLVQALLEGVAMLEARGEIHVGMAIARHIEMHTAAFPLELVLLPVIRRRVEAGGPRGTVTERRLAARVFDALKSELTAPPPPPATFTRSAASLKCDCKVCTELKAFLASPTEASHTFVLKVTARGHLHRHAPSCDVDLVESGTTAPFTIVATKNTKTWQAELERWERGQKRILDIEAFANG